MKPEPGALPAKAKGSECSIQWTVETSTPVHVLPVLTSASAI